MLVYRIFIVSLYRICTEHLFSLKVRLIQSYKFLLVLNAINFFNKITSIFSVIVGIGIVEMI
jgi:hypothetical protein